MIYLNTAWLKDKSNEDKVCKLLSELDKDFGSEDYDVLLEAIKDKLLLLGETKIMKEIDKGSFPFGA